MAVFGLITAYLLAQQSYLLFHSFVEIFSIVAAWSVFVLAFNTRRFLKSGYFIFLGTGFLFSGILDLFHTLAYKGIGVFPGSSDGNLATQLWIAMRYLLGFSFLLAPLFIRKKTGFVPLFTGFSIVTAVLLFTILWRPVFPVCFVPETGLTAFKKISEYVICIILTASLWLLNRNRTAFHADVFRLLCWSVTLTVASELSFTFYKDTSGLFNVVGHLLEVLAFLAAYKAIVEKGLNQPHDLVFYDLKQHEAALRESEQRYRALFNSMTEGFALHEIICDDQGIPCDCRFLEVNPAFEEMTGLKRQDVIGKTQSEVLPGNNPDWISKFGNVALTGDPVRFENYSAALNRHYDVFAYRPAPGQFAAIFMDVTELKKMQDEISYLATFPTLNRNPVTESDIEGTLCYANPAARQLFPDIEKLGGQHPWISDWAAAVSFCHDTDAVLPSREVVIGGRWFYQTMNFMASSRRLRIYGVDITDLVETRRREKEALATASAARSAADIVNAMDEGVVLMRLDGTVININPAALAFAALQEQEVVGKNISRLLPDLLDGEDLEMATAALAAIAQKQTPVLHPVLLRRPQSPPLYLIPSVTFIESPQGPVMAAVTLKDITALHENTKILERVFNNSHISIVYLDPKFNFIRVNQTYADACGRPAVFFTGKNHFDLYPHKENERIFRQVVDDGKPYTVYDKPFEFPDHPEWGVTYWNWSLQPIKDAQGRVEALIFCLQDTTARRTALSALEESERKYRELVENANSIIMRVTPDQRITFFNEYAQKFFGYSAEEVLGKSVLETIVPPVDSAGNDLRQMAAAITARPELYATHENENICKNGRRVWISWTNKVVRDEQGRLKEIFSVGTDATARKQIQDENLRYQERLRGLAEELAASEELERWQISRYIHDTVVQNLSLSSMKLGGLQSALTKAGFDESALTLQTTRTLIGDAIDECRNAMSELTPPLLYELGLIPALIDLADRLKEQHRIPVSVKESGVPDNMNNALRSILFQSAREFIINALKHADCSRIDISAVMIENKVHVSVQDNGRGFDLGSLNRHKPAEGGFGLFSVRERAEILGGRLEIQSVPGRGTKVGITLPFAENKKQEPGAKC